jgi:hypothetical protein
MFAEHDREIPPVRVTCGFPSHGALPGKKTVWGQCWDGDQTEDGVPQVFVTPLLRNAEVVLATLAHELIHAHRGVRGESRGGHVRQAGPWHRS